MLHLHKSFKTILPFLPFPITIHFSSSQSPTNSTLIDHLELNKYLKQNLIKNRINQLKPFQYQCLEKSKDKENLFINSCTGSGKTLAYLLPILDRVMNLNQVQTTSNTAQQQQKQPPKKHGALILTLNKQLCLQLYKTIRLLDPSSHLKLKRTGPITHYIPVIKQLSQQTKTQEQEQLINAKINKNLVRTIKWSKTDILISTPQLLYNIMTLVTYGKNRRDKIWPEFVVIDEADLLLEIDKNIRGYTYKLIEKLNQTAQQLGNLKTKQLHLKQNKIQYFISTSSFPKKMDNIDHTEALQKRFHQMYFVQGQLKHQIPHTIDLFFIQIYKSSHTKLFYLKDILKSRNSQKAIIFCNNKKSIQQVTTLLKQLDIAHGVYHASLDSSQRSRVLNSFDNDDIPILVSTDLGSRGLDFRLPIHYIIEYDMAQNVTGFINRVGRTGRNNIKGSVITMVSQENQELFKHIQELVSQNQKLEQLFSRKRSFSRLYKDHDKQDK